MSDLYQEIKEDLKEDKFWGILKKFAPIFGGIVVIVIISAIGYSWYKSQKDSKAYADSSEFVTASIKLAVRNVDDAMKKFDELSKSSSSYASLSKFHIAGAAVVAKDYTKAINVYKEIFEDKNNDSEMRNIAKTYEMYCISEAGAMSAEDQVKQYETAIKDLEGSAYEANVKELLALTYLANNQKAEAAEILNKLSTDFEIPQTMSRRIDAYKQLM